jgi:hypothetical protein
MKEITSIIRLQFRLPKDIHAALVETAAANDRSLNGQIVNILREWLEKNGQPKSKGRKP